MRQGGRRRNCSLARSFQSWQESMQRGHMEIYTHHKESGLGKTKKVYEVEGWTNSTLRAGSKQESKTKGEASVSADFTE